MIEVAIPKLDVSKHLKMLAWLQNTSTDKCIITSKRSGYGWTIVFKFELSEDATAFKLVFDV